MATSHQHTTSAAAGLDPPAREGPSHARPPLVLHPGVRPSRIAFLVVTVLGLLLPRIYSLHEPVEMDQATYASMGDELLHGESLYTDVWDNKPPGVYVTFAAAQLLAGPGPLSVWWLGLVVATLTGLSLYLAARALTGSSWAAAAGVTLWASVSGLPTIEANQPNAEVFLNLFLPVVLAGYVEATRPGPRKGLAPACGLALFLATFYKPIAVFAGGAAGLALLIPVHASSLRERLRFLASAALVCALGWILVFGYFASSGRLDAAWDAMVTFNASYNAEKFGTTLENIWNGLGVQGLFPPRIAPLYVLLAFAFTGIAAGLANPRWRSPAAILAGFAVGSAIQIICAGRYFGHYYQYWLPVACLGTAFALVLSASANRERLLALGAVLVCMLLFQWRFYTIAPGQWSLEKHGPRLLLNQELASWLDEQLAEGKTFLQWGQHAELYFYAGRRVPIPELRAELIYYGDRTPERIEEVVRALGRQEVPLVVGTGSWLPSRRNDPVSLWIREHYARVDVQLPPRLRQMALEFWVRPGTPLHGRLAGSS